MRMHLHRSCDRELGCECVTDSQRQDSGNRRQWPDPQTMGCWLEASHQEQDGWVTMTVVIRKHCLMIASVIAPIKVFSYCPCFWLWSFVRGHLIIILTACVMFCLLSSIVDSRSSTQLLHCSFSVWRYIPCPTFCLWDSLALQSLSISLMTVRAFCARSTHAHAHLSFLEPPSPVSFSFQLSFRRIFLALSSVSLTHSVITTRVLCLIHTLYMHISSSAPIFSLHSRCR